MEILILILITSATIGNVYGIDKCVTISPANCSQQGDNTSLILVDNHYPQSNCSSVKINDRTYVYDTLNITKVWITLINKDKNCDSKAMGQMKSELNLTNEEVIFIEVQEKYFRIIFAIPNNNYTLYKTVTFPTRFEQRLKITNYILYPIINEADKFSNDCLNGGSIDINYTGAGIRCKCHKRSIIVGSRCEYLDRVLNSSIYYFNTFRDDKYIEVSFSLYSNGVKKNQSLVTIKNSNFDRVIEVSLSESILFLISADKDINTTLIIDKQEWHDFSIKLTTKNVSLVTYNKSLSIDFTTELNGTFKSNYLVLKEDNSSEYDICIRNLKTNGQILDLNNADGYVSCCSDRCECVENQDCVCSPFISRGNTECFCKIGYVKSDLKCITSESKYSEIKESKVVPYTTTNNINRVDFKFRTRSAFGTLISLSIDQNNTIATKINQSLLELYVANITKKVNYNVSDGQFHSVTLIINKASLELILDDNPNYSVTFIGWTVKPQILSLDLGPLYDPFKSSVNTFSTCFSEIRLNGKSSSQTDINITSNPNILSQCSTGPRCDTVNINCAENQKCSDILWQNTMCICKDNFTSTGTQCIYYKCLPNPCQNDGECFYNSSIVNYQCLCKSGYQGDKCEIGPPLVAALWWIAIIVVLLLLLIIIIVILVYCCCCRNKQVTNSPYIKEIHENAVIYNEQAGECDYNGPPINYDLMMKALDNKGYMHSAPVNPGPDLMSKKLDVDKNNKDLILDHPLEYGYEGYNSDNESVSSLGSNSTNSQLNTMPLDNSNNRFTYLNNLYK